MTDSAILIGLISAVHVMGFQLPQLLMARSVSRLTRYKPMVDVDDHPRTGAFPGPGADRPLLPAAGPVPAIILTFYHAHLAGIWGRVYCQCLAEYDQQSHPVRLPGHVFWSAVFRCQPACQPCRDCAPGCSFERQPFPNNFRAVFCDRLWDADALIRSPSALPANLEHQVIFSTRDQPPLWHSMRDIVKRDPNFDWFLVARTLVQFGTMAFSFYTVYAASRLMAGAYTVGVLTSVLMITQVVFNPLLGWFADRWSRKGVLEIGAVAIFLSAMIARFAPNRSPGCTRQ